MNATIYPGRLSGTVKVPASKSAAHRALIAAALGDGEALVRLSATNRDIEATMRCLSALGAEIAVADDGIHVRPLRARRGANVELDCGESGSTLRFLLPLACALGVKARFTGRGRLPERPNAPLVEALRQRGATIDADRLPMTVEGLIAGGTFALPGDISSQYVTGLLFALPLLREDSDVVLTTALESAAYVDMTLRTLRQFGIRADAVPDGWHIPGGQAYALREGGRVDVEGDWSAAAFWLAANALGSDIRLEGLSDDTAQGDRAVADLLGRPRIDASGVPDLVPALAVAAAARHGRTVITGAARLRLKESDRLTATADLLNALGGRAKATEDALVIEGGRPLHGGTVDGRNDHRIVMAAAVAATVADAPVTITDAQAVDKSYPGFFRDFVALGGHADVRAIG